jgi:hypothetical protein
MTSIAVIKGLTSDEKLLYTNFAAQLDDFAVNYNNYITACNKGDNASCNIIRNKLNAMGITNNGDIDTNGTLASYQNISNRNRVSQDTLSLNKNLQKKKAELDENTKILNDLDNSIEGDHVSKMNSSFYTNTVVYISLACVIYFSFYKISS